MKKKMSSIVFYMYWMGIKLIQIKVYYLIPNI